MAAPLEGTWQEHVVGHEREFLSLKDLGLGDSGFPLSLKSQDWGLDTRTILGLACVPGLSTLMELCSAYCGSKWDL